MSFKNGRERMRALMQIAERDGGFNCKYCGRELQAEWNPNRLKDCACIDHVIPLSRGGANHIDNYVIACHSCNASKHTRTPDEYETWKQEKRLDEIDPLVPIRRSELEYILRAVTYLATKQAQQPGSTLDDVVDAVKALCHEYLGNVLRERGDMRHE